jgi:hypothetical protein
MQFNYPIKMESYVHQIIKGPAKLSVAHWLKDIAYANFLYVCFVYKLLLLMLKILSTLVTKQATSMRRSTVLSLPPQIVFPAISNHQSVI